MRFLFAAASLFALAACQPDPPQSGSSKSEEAKAQAEREKMGQDDPNVPFVPASVGPSSQWNAMSKTAMSFTPGVVTITPTPQKSDNLPEGMIFSVEKGFTYEATLMPGGATQGGDNNHVKWDDVFTTLNGAKVDPEKIVMYAVDSEKMPPQGDPGAPNGGFCGKTAFLAMYTVPDATSGEILTVAAFDSDVWPPKDDKSFCGNFAYTPVDKRPK